MSDGYIDLLRLLRVAGSNRECDNSNGTDQHYNKNMYIYIPNVKKSYPHNLVRRTLDKIELR